MNLFATFEKMSNSDEKFKKFTMYSNTIILYNYTTIQLQCTSLCIQLIFYGNMYFDARKKS